VPRLKGVVSGITSLSLLSSAIRIPLLHSGSMIWCSTMLRLSGFPFGETTFPCTLDLIVCVKFF
jgi:hypothetical protein